MAHRHRQIGLPLAAPLQATCAANGLLAFSADAAAAGKYTMLASAPGYTLHSTASAVALVTIGSVATKNLVLAP